MSTATEFLGEVSHFYHTNLLAVFLAKQCHCPGFLCFLNGKHFRYNRQISCDFLVDNCLYLCNFFCSHCLEMVEVKTQTFCIIVGTGLFYMVS